MKEEQKVRLAETEAKGKEATSAMEAAAKAELAEWHAKNDKAKAEKASGPRIYIYVGYMYVCT